MSDYVTQYSSRRMLNAAKQKECMRARRLKIVANACQDGSDVLVRQVNCEQRRYVKQRNTRRCLLSSVAWSRLWTKWTRCRARDSSKAPSPSSAASHYPAFLQCFRSCTCSMLLVWGHSKFSQYPFHATGMQIIAIFGIFLYVNAWHGIFNAVCICATCTCILVVEMASLMLTVRLPN